MKASNPTLSTLCLHEICSHLILSNTRVLWLDLTNRFDILQLTGQLVANLARFGRPGIGIFSWKK